MDFKETLKKGVKIVALNSNEELHGTVLQYIADQNIIELEGVYDKKSNYQYDSAIVIHTFNYNLKIYAEVETKAITPNRSNSSSNPIASDSSCEASGNSEESRNTEAPATLDNKNDFQRSITTNQQLYALNKILKTKQVIDSKDQNYDAAIEYLEMEPIVSLAFETKDGNDNKDIRCMCLASWNKVFLFNFYRDNLFNGRLRDILRNNHIKKIVYSSSVIYYFQVTLNIELRNTIVLTDFLNRSSHNETGNNHLDLTNLIHKYLGLTQTFTTSDETKFRDLIKISETSVFQLKVFDIIFNKKLLADFYSRNLSFSKVLSEKSDIDAACLVLNTNQPGVEAINPLNENWKYPLKEYHKNYKM